MAPLLLLVFFSRLNFAQGAATIPGATAQAKIVESHNKFRCSMCDTPPLAWDDAIAQNAKDYMATGAVTTHCPSRDGSISGCIGNGENMMSAFAGDDAGEWERTVDMWFASEIACYNFDDGSSTCAAGHMTGHMTQVAWDLSTKVGCASNDAATGGQKTMCMYQEPGNSYTGPLFNTLDFINHVHKCPTAKQYNYYTGARQQDGSGSLTYFKDTTTTGCPAKAGGCSIHPSCSASGSPTQQQTSSDSNAIGGSNGAGGSACTRPAGWCDYRDTYTDGDDCDGDGVADPHCQSGGNSGFRGSASGCVDNWPNGACQVGVTAKYTMEYVPPGAARGVVFPGLCAVGLAFAVVVGAVVGHKRWRQANSPSLQLVPAEE